MSEAVKGSGGVRNYDSSRRRERANESRREVLSRARELLLSQGFGTTTIAQIARAAGVSGEFVYKNFGGKPGLVRAIYDESLLGIADTPAEARSDRAQQTETDPRALMAQFGRFVAEISPLGSPVLLLIRDAAASGDADMAVLLREVDDLRYQRMLHNARQVISRELLRPGLSEAETADVFFAMTSAELYETLVLKRGWTPERLGRFVEATLVAQLL
ncbi:TetR/AcrR family transcriptional regulator [Sinomonas sp. ASV322]|uniref:TetR/AcrR family transcriptional regulator n=1 Tax=Sinomonas sp. ASV322 TaxID=3041920 RepID=UPI0027DE711C|nr:TetR/AcrR family transcriptional regulator [Sinomonas sp. ASV322]MDQ4501354.1 TetR/AcrR family transcriptional regulator [Sinomonas sp. ASV322]